MPIDKWDACKTPINLEALKGRTCFAGLDLSTTLDISALVLVFPPVDGDPKYYVLPYFFIPSDNIRDRVRRDRVPYDVWKRHGYLTATDGNVIDYSFIRAKVHELSKLYQIEEIVYDRWNATQLTTQQLAEEDGFTCLELGQGFASMNAPVKRLMELVISARLAHGNNPVLRWMASNAVAKEDPAGNLKLDKSKSQEKIDGMVALCMALARAETALPKPKDSAGIFLI